MNGKAEEIVWVMADSSGSMPDSDRTVLVYHTDEDEPVWMGYHDGKTWRNVNGTRIAVRSWAEMPAGRD